MGFFDRLLNSNKGKVSSPSSSSLGKHDPSVVCELEMDGTKYMLEEFDINFDKSNGERDVALYAVFGDDITSELESWITYGNKRMDGRVRFYFNNDKLEHGAMFSANFYDAVCVRIRKSYDGDNPTTMLMLSAKGIKLGNEEYVVRE